MRLPGAFRRLPRPSSALKPSHSPDGVICRAVGGVHWRLVNTLRYMCASLLFVRGVILSLVAQFTLHSASCGRGVACFDSLPYIWRAILEAFVADISVASAWYKGCVVLFLYVSWLGFSTCCGFVGLCVVFFVGFGFGLGYSRSR
jgi:hypothetical protein